MDRLARIRAWLDANRLLAGALALVTAATLVAAVALGSGSGRMALLYAGLDPAAAGEVIAALDAGGTPYDVRGTAIYVPSARRDALRLDLAARDLPTPGAAGYEILDGLSGFGTTARMFDAAYWRAREGELARTILADPAIRQARVHLAVPMSDGLISRGRASASVRILSASATIGVDRARGLRHLVASAVPALGVEDVSIIGPDGRVIEKDAMPGGDSEALARRIERLLEAHVGVGRARVEVAYATVQRREQVRERRVDPESRVVISTQTDEREARSQGMAPGSVTVASDLPDGDAGAGSSERRTDDAETSERTNYDMSETTRETVLEPGGIRRMTVAVLIDETPDAPRSAEEVESLHDLVASAAGFDEARGDVITVRSLSFHALPADDLPAVPPASAAPPAWMLMTGLASIVLVILVVLLMRRRAAPPLLPEMTAIGTQPEGSERALPGPSVAPEDAADRLKALMRDRREETAAILKGWLDQGQETGT